MSNRALKFQGPKHEVIVNVGDNGVNQLIVNGQPVDLSSKNENLRINIFTDNLNVTLDNGDVVNVKSRGTWATSPKEPDQYAQTSMGATTVRSLEVKVNGTVLEPQANVRQSRDIDTMKELYDRYTKIGELDYGQFLALKAMAGHEIQPINPSSQSIDIALDRDGGFGEEQMVLTRLKANSLSAGDTFRVQGGDAHTAKSINIQRNDAMITFTPVHVTIECNDITYTNYPYERDLRNLKHLVEKGAMSMDDVKNLLPEHCTYDEFRVAQELHQRGIELSDPLLASLQQGMCVDDALREAYNEAIAMEEERFEELAEDMDLTSNPLVNEDVEAGLEDLESNPLELEDVETIQPDGIDGIEPIQPEGIEIIQSDEPSQPANDGVEVERNELDIDDEELTLNGR